ncbi:MAG TPA: hypothetical protein ENJ60_06925 [Aeromonadales bacterium]|nr:hypothetical protein [Aeromonadales bacterium]
MLRTRTSVSLLLTLFLSVGCGQKGALYMPSKPESKVKKDLKPPPQKSVKKDEAQQQKPAQH